MFFMKLLENEDVMDNLLSFKGYKTSLYDARRSRIPKIPHSKADISLEGEWIVVSSSMPMMEKIVGTMQNLRHLCAADTIFMDGTFTRSANKFAEST